MTACTTLHSLADLSQFGVGILTGEADPFGMRLLCDLTEDGRDLVCAYLGGHDLDCFPLNWNSSVAGVRSVASVMLSRAALADLCVFALFFRGKADVVLSRGGSFTGIPRDHEYYDRYEALVASSEGYTVYRRPASGPHASARNVHAITGRTQ